MDILAQFQIGRIIFIHYERHFIYAQSSSLSSLGPSQLHPWHSSGQLAPIELAAIILLLDKALAIARVILTN